MSHGVVPAGVAAATRGSLAPLARRLRAIGLSANTVTVAGLALTLAGAAFLAAGQPLGALVFLVAGSLCDTLDGAVARADGGGTRFGSFLDSTLDRLSEGVLFCGAAALGASRSDPLLLWSALAALLASFLVSYARARAEPLGIAAATGVAPREARLVIMLVGLGGWALTGQFLAFTAAVAAVAVLAALTFLQRVALVARGLSDGGN